MGILYISVAVAVVPVAAACFLKNRSLKILLSVISFLGVLLTSFLSGAFLLPNFIGSNGGWLSLVYGGLFFAAFLLPVFKPFSQKARRIAMALFAGVFVLLTAIFVVPSVYRASIEQAPEEVNLREYMPFGETKAAELSEGSTLKLTGELPRLDGATALYPVYSAFVRSTYPAPPKDSELYEYSPYGDLRSEESKYRPFAACSTTPRAFENLIDGYADVAFLMGVSGVQREMAAKKGLDLVLTPIGRDAFVFIVNSQNPVDSLSSNDIRRIYGGEAKNWSEVGGSNDEIRAYQRPDESGSQTMLKQIMRDTPLVAAPKDEIYDTMIGLYEQIADYRNYKNALGYSFRYYIMDMIGENKVKFLSIDSIAPTPENILNNTYPYANDFYAVTVKRNGQYLNPACAENVRALLAWIQGPQGQYLVKETGYVPIS